MSVIACRACNAAHPKITSERIKVAGKGDGTKRQTYIFICHHIGRGDREKCAFPVPLSLLLWIPLLSVSYCGKK